ncbi:MAG: endonuclease/exonuclease/phosphatase family protein [Clostridia bacterium]|nr:endonuclease/exonuclease/phosphatase family protein [Clostridia bacterium]
MKKYIIKIPALLLLLAVCAAALFGCASGAPVQSDTEKNAATGKATETENKTAEKQTERITAEATETERPATVAPEHIDVRAAVDKGIKNSFTKAKYCTVNQTEDGEEGKVLTLTTSNIKKANQRTPAVVFDYSGFCKSIGSEPLDISKNQYVVMKIKADGLHDRLFTLTAAATDKDGEPTKAEATAKIPSGDGWHYLTFDFSKAAKADKFKVFRINFEQLAASDGESVSISEIRVCDEEEAAKYAEEEVYPLEERTAGDYKLSILQFNVQTENGNAAPFIIRSELYRRFVDEHKPDVVGMEEVTTNWRKWLDTYVFNDSYAGVGEPRTAGGEANPIYYRKDKFELVEYGTFWLSDTPDKAGSSVKGANYPRICTWAILKDKVTGTQFAHINTHLDHNGNNDSATGNTIRKEQMSVIIKFAAEKFGDLPQFLTGDLNNRRTTSKGKTYALIQMIEGAAEVTDENGAAYRMALSDSRLNAPVTVGENHTATMMKYFDENDKAYEPSREPIDYVFYNAKNTEALTYETFLISEEGNLISDHLPVFTTFEIK